MLICFFNEWYSFRHKGAYVGVPSTTPSLDDSLGGLTGLSMKSVILMACDLLHQKDTEPNCQREKMRGAKSRGLQEQASRVLSQKSRTECTWVPQHWAMTTCVKCCQPTNLVRNSVPRVLIRGCTERHLLPGRYPNSKLPEGKHVFSINHIVHTNSFGTVSHSYQLMVVGTLPKSGFLDISQGPTL